MRYLVLLFLLCIFSISYAQTTSNMEWKAGLARMDITPTQNMWLGGYASRTHASEGARHSLWIKALALEDGEGQRSVMVSMDLINMPKEISDSIRKRLKEDYDLEPAQIMLNVSHTHTGPEVRPSAWKLEEAEEHKIIDYVDALEKSIVQLVGMAIKDMEPARIFSGNGLSRFQVNRRNNKESELKSYTELKGPNDYAVPVIKVMDKRDKLKAILFGYACHPTVLSDYQFSGDYPGYAQQELEERYPGTTAMFFQGAGGDQNPLPRRKVQLAEQYGQTLAASVDQVLKSEMTALSAKLSVAYAEVNIGMQDGAPCAEDLEPIADEDSEYPGYLKHRAQVLLDKVNSEEGLKKDYPYPVQVWSIGEQKVFALGGELLIGYAIELKRLFGDDIFVFGYSNDVMGYIPTVTVLREGGYEGNRSPYFTNPWESNIEYLIIDQASDLAKKIGVEKVSR